MFLKAWCQTECRLQSVCALMCIHLARREVRAVIMGIMFSQCVGDTATGLYMVKNPTVKFSLKWTTKE